MGSSESLPSNDDYSLLPFHVADRKAPPAAGTASNAFQPAKLGQNALGRARRLLLEHPRPDTEERSDDDRLLGPWRTIRTHNADKAPSQLDVRSDSRAASAL
jgi:hypothetical protein